jgi:cell division septation protein DedD
VKNDDDLLDLHDDERDREISLGTSTILGIFFALALVCAAFFGLGYSMGRKSAQVQAVVTAPAPDKTDANFSNFKSAPSDSGSAAEGQEAAPADTTTAPAVSEKASAKPVVLKETKQPANAPADTPRSVAPPTAATPATVATGQFLVQVSAPSRQGDADALIAALGHKGYTAFIRKEPQDQYFHVQIGPFASKKDAEAMRQRLDADGYKPFIK